MERDIRLIHNNLYDFLMNYADYDRAFTFSLRKSNRAGKLEQGYWFYGNDNYIAVSFWTGMDWKNKTPNISFIIDKAGRTSLIISTSDSDEKTEFVKEHLIYNLDGNNIYIDDISLTGRGYSKVYKQFGEEYLDSLKYFIENDKKVIDRSINEAGFRANKLINFISEPDFHYSINKVEMYKSPLLNRNDNDSKLQSLNKFRIAGYGPIIDTGFINVPSETQWIFFTGENGTGKTSLLRAIASALCYTKINLPSEVHAAIHLSLEDGLNNSIEYDRINNDGINKRKPIVTGFCSYGASRLKTSTIKKGGFSIEKALSKVGLTDSLFNFDSILIDIQDQLNYWERSEELSSITKLRKEAIKEVLVDILPNVFDVRFSKAGALEKTLYVEKDNNGKELPAVTFEYLASGLKSLVAMVGDMMMRLFNQQNTIADPAELSGIVMIDEIDLHLHPKLQKYLVEQLTKTFPKVQFIATTHSPIPLLGAPINSCFFKVERDAFKGVEVIDLTEIKVQNLLPNAILTSELFNMNNLFSRDLSIETIIRTEDTYENIVMNDKVKARLKKIAASMKMDKKNNDRDEENK